MKIKCLVIDDEPLARKGMQEYIAEIDFLELTQTCENAMQANAFLHHQEINLIFLDIEMPKLSGIDFLKQLKKPPAVILTTAYSNYALESYELDVIDYLVKPISFQRFFKAVMKAKDFLAAKSGENLDAAASKGYFFVKVNNKFEKVHYEEVLFVEALQNYVAIHLARKKLVSYITLSNIEKQLPATLFMRVHKSYIVALDKIGAIELHSVLIGSTKIPVSRTLKEKLRLRVVESRLVKR
ncbi:MAG TPA: LytTR family DNA-binding domain-containing protein [Chitinophagaceae bacterium]|jgi:DNA-binding LytR/AlgR family response regulator|nr:LytTR family DNA-binding domain-containing protein [Chitinophagaceae bacterium]